MKHVTTDATGDCFWPGPRLAVLLPALLFVSLAGCRQTPFVLEVELPRTHGLKPGDNITLRGLAIGQVRDIDIDASAVVVRAEIKPRFKAHVREGCVFRVEPEKLVTGKMMLAVTPAAEPGAPLAPGARVRGISAAAGPIERLERTLTHGVDHARAQATGLGRAILSPDQHPPRATGATIDLDQPGAYLAYIESVRVYDQKADGDAWDSVGGGGPDLLVQIWVDDRPVLVTPAVNNTLHAEWDLPTERFPLRSKTTMQIKVLDRDMGFNDEIGVVTLSPTPADADIGRRFRLAAGRVAELRIRLERAPAEAQPHAEPSDADDSAP